MVTREQGDGMSVAETVMVGVFSNKPFAISSARGAFATSRHGEWFKNFAIVNPHNFAEAIDASKTVTTSGCLYRIKDKAGGFSMVSMQQIQLDKTLVGVAPPLEMDAPPAP